jgi:RNA polymerase sigma-70 factor (ECF subfamily)
VQLPKAPTRLIERPDSYRMLSDIDLITKANDGDRRALDTLVERYAPRVQRLASQLMENVEDARDAAQESLVKLCTRLRQFRGDAQFATWLHRLVVNTCRDLQDRARVRQADPLPDREEAAGDEADPSWATAMADLRRELSDGLLRLSGDQRAAVFLRDVCGLSYEDVARVARMPVGTAKCYVHRGRARLRAGLEERLPELTDAAPGAASRAR